MFNKIVAIEPVSLVPEAVEKLKNYGKEIILYDDLPQTDAEIIRRIGDADAVLVSYTTSISAAVIEALPHVEYIGMCCSLYSPESANVDIRAAQAHGICVKGIRDYGDEGVVEYVVSELVRYLHGFGPKQYRELPLEIKNLKVGIVGMGTTGIAISDALQFFGADIKYYSRTRKPEQEAKGRAYRELKDLLKEVDVVFSCLNKNVILFNEAEMKTFGNGKIFFNTSIGPSYDDRAMKYWLNEDSNELFCDSIEAFGKDPENLKHHPHVNSVGKSSGRTQQAFERLSQKVLENIDTYFLNKA